MSYSNPSRTILSRRLGLLLTISAAILLMNASIVSAQDKFWSVSSGDWSNGSNWGGSEPTWYDAYIINGGTATISSSGETCFSLFLGGSNTGTVQMIAGEFSTQPGGSVYVGNQGNRGTFIQSGGTSSLTFLTIGNNPTASGFYNLSDIGFLNAIREDIGVYGSGTFAQAGGTNNGEYVNIGLNGVYTHSEGTLNLHGGLTNKGYWDLSSSSASINATSSIIDLTGGTLSSSANAYLTLDAHSLLIVPAGFIPEEHFMHYSNLGTVHQAGSPLTISSSQTIYGYGEISDHVSCQGGTLSVPVGGDSTFNSLVLNGGLNISAGGKVDLGWLRSKLYINDTTSGMSGGSLHTRNQYVGYSQSGKFTQTGGTTSDTSIYLGYYSNDNGIYELSGSGVIDPDSSIRIGKYGTGTFIQSGGTNTAGNIVVGDSHGSVGYYELNAGFISSDYEYIGSSGTGTLTQIGGTNSISQNLYLGYNSTGNGTYNLNGGTLILKSLSKGPGTATFNFGGGTLKASGTMSCSLPMALTGTGGNANVNTNGYAVTLSGALSGTGGLNKLGGGTLTLSGENTFTGSTTVGSGVLNLGSQNALQYSTFTGGTGTLIFDSAVTSHAFIFGGLSGSNNLDLRDNASNPVALSVGKNGANTTYSGILSGSGGLNKLGGGTLTLTGANSYAGRTTLLASGGSTSAVVLGPTAQSLVLSGGGADIQAGKMIFNAVGNPGLAETIRLGLSASYNHGNWDAGQFHSTTAEPWLYALGWTDGLPLEGTTSDPTQITVMYTLAGDTDLDGSIGTSDLNTVLSYYGQNHPWKYGDFDYDNIIGASDLGVLLTNYGMALPGEVYVGGLNLDGAAIGALNAYGIDAVVPEPGTLVLLLAAGLGWAIYVRRLGFHL